jgi:hypothetical protein
VSFHLRVLSAAQLAFTNNKVHKDPANEFNFTKPDLVDVCRNKNAASKFGFAKPKWVGTKKFQNHLELAFTIFEELDTYASTKWDFINSSQTSFESLFSETQIRGSAYVHLVTHCS